MYLNLQGELARKRIAKNEFAAKMGMPYSTLIYKLSEGRFTVDEAFKAHDIIDSNIDLRYLFKSEQSNA